MPGSEDFGAAAFQAATDVSRETLVQLQRYVDVLQRWAPRVNLIGPSTLDDIWRRHILDSAQLWPHLPDNSKTLVDFGSGAGFPGMVLAIMGVPDVHLVESNQRKCVFLREVARAAGVNVTVHASRIEALTPFPVDVVTARALASLPILLEYAEPFLKSNTICLFPKGQRVNEELTETQKRWNITHDVFSSLTDPTGGIVRLEAISRVDPC